jgi:hypothetical protein
MIFYRWVEEFICFNLEIPLFNRNKFKVVTRLLVLKQAIILQFKPVNLTTFFKSFTNEFQKEKFIFT